MNATLDEFSRDRGDLAAAALAFYALLSLAPLIIIAVALASIVLGQDAAQAEVGRMLQGAMGPSASATVRDWAREAAAAGGVASLVGAGLSLLTASRLAEALRAALNQVWNVDVKLAEGFKSSVTQYLGRRVFAFALVLASGPLLLAVCVSRALLSGASTLFLPEALRGVAVSATQFLFSLLLVAALAAALFRLVPDTRVGYRALFRGALLTSVLFNLGNLAVGLYLARASFVATYGAAGSAVVVLLWLYYSAQALLFGAEFTQVYAERYGAGLTPADQEDVRRAHAEASRLRAAGPRTRPST